MDAKNGLDKIDLAILRALQKDARITIKEMAASMNLSTTPIFERLRKLERKGYIEKQVAIVNPSMLNLKLTVFISLSISDHSSQALEQFVDEVVQLPEVLECHHVTGKSDFLLKVILEDIEKYNEFILHKLSTVGNIANVESSFSLSTRKMTQELPI